jgi:hypothetical protein
MKPTVSISDAVWVEHGVTETVRVLGRATPEELALVVMVITRTVEAVRLKKKFVTN